MSLGKIISFLEGILFGLVIEANIFFIEMNISVFLIGMRIGTSLNELILFFVLKNTKNLGV